MAKTFKDYKDWIDTYENPTESEKELIDGFKDILDEIFVNHQKALDEKDKEYGILLADKDKL